MRHSDLSKFVIQNSRKLPYATKCYLWSNPSGRRGRISFGQKGTADIIGFNYRGVFCALELKQDKEPLSKEQVSFQEKLNSTELGSYWLIRDEETALQALSHICGIDDIPW